MPSKPPKPQQAPFQQQEQTATTYAPQSIAGTPEAQAFLDVPIDVDPGVGRRTDLAEQEAENRANSVFGGGGVPSFFRQQALEKEKRDIRGQGAYEAQAAQFGRNQLELGRRERLLPQILQTGGSGSTSGFQTQFPQSQPGFWQRAALGAISGGGQAARMFATGGMG